jgi:hypothetical protein
MFEASQDELAIRNLVESWAIWRDSGDWERLRTTWHEGGRMQTTWFSGTGEEFVAGSQAAFNRGIEVLHTLSGTSVDVQGTRAIAQTKMAINQRSEVEGVLCDCVCMGRFYDFLEKRGDRWGIVIRQPIYEMDRLDPVDSGASLDLDKEKLASLPAGYRHLAYLQMKIGLKVRLDLPQTRGAVVEALYAEGRKWLQAADNIQGEK